jgi:hypothetical protein
LLFLVYSQVVPIFGQERLETALEAMIQPETRIEPVMCDDCKMRVPTSYRSKFNGAKLPQHLILSLGRFHRNLETQRLEKLNHAFEFPWNSLLNLAPYCENLPAGSAANYRLSGLVVHSGHLNGGHYYSYIRLANNEWMEFNDSHLRMVSNEIPSRCFGGSHSSASAYMLFYERVESTALTISGTQVHDPMVSLHFDPEWRSQLFTLMPVIITEPTQWGKKSNIRLYKLMFS